MAQHPGWAEAQTMLDASPGQTAPSSPEENAMPAATRLADPAAAQAAGNGAGKDQRPSPGAAARRLWMDTSAEDLELERMHHGTPIQCQFCVGQKFRRSRLRLADIRQLLLMRYPVRCTRCSQRQTVSFTVAGVSAPSYLRQRDGRPSGSRRPGPNSASQPASRERIAPAAASPQTPAQPSRAISEAEPDV